MFLHPSLNEHKDIESAYELYHYKDRIPNDTFFLLVSVSFGAVRQSYKNIFKEEKAYFGTNINCVVISSENVTL